MKKYEKKEIRVGLDQIDFEGDVEINIKCLQTVMKNHRKKGFFKFYIEKDTRYEYEGYDYLQLYGTRLETDEELAKRTDSDKVRSAAAKKAAKTKAIKKEERERERERERA